MTPATEPSLPLMLSGSHAVEALVPAFLPTSGAVSPKTWITEAENDPDDKGGNDKDEAEDLQACVVRRFLP